MKLSWRVIDVMLKIVQVRQILCGGDFCSLKDMTTRFQVSAAFLVVFLYLFPYVNCDSLLPLSVFMVSGLFPRWTLKATAKRRKHFFNLDIGDD